MYYVAYHICSPTLLCGPLYMWPSLPTVWPHNLHHQARACPCRVPNQPTLLPGPIPVSTQNCKKYISLVISAIKTRVMMNFNLLIVRDPVIFSNLVGAGQGRGDLGLAVIYLRAPLLNSSLHQ